MRTLCALLHDNIGGIYGFVKPFRPGGHTTCVDMQDAGSWKRHADIWADAVRRMCCLGTYLAYAIRDGAIFIPTLIVN